MAPRALLGLSGRDLGAWVWVAVGFGMQYLYSGTPFWKIHAATPMTGSRPPLLWAGGWVLLVLALITMLSELVLAVRCALQRAMETSLEGAAAPRPDDARTAARAAAEQRLGAAGGGPRRRRAGRSSEHEGGLGGPQDGGSSDSGGEGGGGGGGGGAQAERARAAEDARQRLERMRAMAAVARDAEERGAVWLRQHAGGAGGPAARAAAERLAEDRALRGDQDDEYAASLAADAAAAAARAAAAAARKALTELKAGLRAALPEEPPPGGGGGAAAVRVRLPSGEVAERRWADGAAVRDITDWVQGLEELPLSFEPGGWCLATNMPRVLLRDREQLLADAVGGASSIALFVVQL
ncbi:MAG: hypothetical protein J3K34DRAFT_518991 [Monoraphidium minutum]|nr:MAG: hypothetical protein J3K34DRAFT_518991 [Monoraphidium minutum]